jgi:uncharacterized protein
VIVVSNTSPLTNLAAIGQFPLLQKLYGEIKIATGVWHELNAGGRIWPGSVEVSNASWIVQHDVENLQMVTALRRDLDRGEAESIVLALELEADLILLDERDGRNAARRLGLQVVGVLGVLLEAKATGLITAVRPHIDDLRQDAGFYVSNSVYRSVLHLAQE